MGPFTDVCWPGTLYVILWQRDFDNTLGNREQSPQEGPEISAEEMDAIGSIMDDIEILMDDIEVLEVSQQRQGAQVTESPMACRA